MHYVNARGGQPLVLPHRQSSWRFAYRRPLVGLSTNVRCTTPNPCGFGPSELSNDPQARPRQHWGSKPIQSSPVEVSAQPHEHFPCPAKVPRATHASLPAGRLIDCIPPSIQVLFPHTPKDGLFPYCWNGHRYRFSWPSEEDLRPLARSLLLGHYPHAGLSPVALRVRGSFGLQRTHYYLSVIADRPVDRSNADANLTMQRPRRGLAFIPFAGILGAIADNLAELLHARRSLSCSLPQG